MKLQKVVTRKLGESTYYKFIITVPNSTVDVLGWSAGNNLQFNVINQSGTCLLISLTSGVGV